MRKVFAILTTALLVVVLCSGVRWEKETDSRSRTTLEVSVNEYVELMEALAHVTGNSVFASHDAPVYQKDVEAFIEPYLKHPCLKALKNMQRQGIVYGAIPSLGLHLEWRDGAFAIAECEESCLDERWTKRRLKRFLPLLSDFYRVSDFHAFFEEHRATCEQAVDCFRQNVADYIDIAWFDGFFGADSLRVSKVVVGLNNGYGNFGLKRHLKDSPKEHISVMGYYTDSLGMPLYAPERHDELVLVHEFCHPHIQAPDSLRAKAEALLEQHRAALQSKGYGTWQEVVEESWVRSSVIRYMLDHPLLYSKEQVDEEIAMERDWYGFVWLPTDHDWYRGDFFHLN